MALAQQGVNQQLEGSRELAYVNLRDSYAGSLFSRIITAVNALAKNAGVAAVGKVATPPPIASIAVSGTTSGSTVSCPSEILHWTINHPGAISKGIKYFSEIDVNPSFTSPHVHDHGTSRSGFLTLPTFSSAANKTSSTPTTYYLRSFAQMPGSDPCAPNVLGGLGSPLGIQMGGTGGSSGTGSVTAILPSTGSGTASSSGQQGGHGLGVVLDRPAPTSKRSV